MSNNNMNVEEMKKSILESNIGNYYTVRDGEVYFSVSLMSKLIHDYKINALQVTVYYAIADYLITNIPNNAITLDYLANVTGLNKSTVLYNATVLAEKGLIKRWIPEKTNKRTTRYDFKVIK